MSAPPPDDGARERPAHASLAAFGEAREPDVWAALGRWRAEGRRMVLLTVVESRGFTPRKPGTHMLLGADGATVGTIGGGAIEQQALREAAGLLAEGGGARTVKKHLTQDLGMCCGGEMVIYLETLEAPPRLFVFGAGYVARPIAALASACGFAVTVIDGREEWATSERFPGLTVRCESPEHAARALETQAEDYAIVVTHDHDLDQRVVQELLRKPLRFTGMIGSLAKQRKFALRLRGRGFTDEQVGRLRTPLGLAIGAQTPEEIAVSVLAELVAVRREASPERGWVTGARKGGAASADAGVGAARPAGRGEVK
ncbi:MAG TPA: xanthine dehydrogenase accessory protein XdhC [Candidatus Acidoferrales bacterium]|nr:xanthine dehydrogenase accessory protein XdhC [Candidatus Acidoferrales bacterium]